MFKEQTLEENKDIFDFLAGCGVPVIRDGCNALPLCVHVKKAGNTLGIRFFSPDERKMYMFDVISGFLSVLEFDSEIPYPKILKDFEISEGNHLGSYEINLLKALSTQAFYVLKNFLGRKKIDLTEVSITYGIMTDRKGPLFGLAEIKNNS